MRILATADLHYALRQFDWVAEHLERYDLLLLAGDLLDLASPVDLDVQALVVRKYLRRFASRRILLTSSGNHDIQNLLPSGERAATWMENLHAVDLKPDYKSFEKEGVVFTVCPWWDGPETQEKTAQILEADSIKPKHTWIWVHHNPPSNTPIA